MSAEVLRRAAALIRERAEAMQTIAPSPWFVLDHDSERFHQVWYGDRAKVLGVDDGTVPEAEWEDVWEHNSTVIDCDVEPPLAAYMASWHPAVVLAVADWLTAVSVDFGSPGHRCWHGPEREALKVARTYLGEPS